MNMKRLKQIIREVLTQADDRPRKIFLGVKCSALPPTRRHRPAIWENMLGTVIACSDDDDAKYFDYDHEAAIKFSGADEDGRDPRVARAKMSLQCGSYVLRKGQIALWVLSKR